MSRRTCVFLWLACSCVTARAEKSEARVLSLVQFAGWPAESAQQKARGAPSPTPPPLYGAPRQEERSPPPPGPTLALTHTPTRAPEVKDEATPPDLDASASSSASSCSVTFTQPEGYIDSSDAILSAGDICCTYTITVYAGYGVELQVKSANLSDGEQLSIRGVAESGAWLVLANQTLLVEGQVIRSPSNTLSVFYGSTRNISNIGAFLLHYQIFRLSCLLPKRPHFGEVSVLDLLPGGTARFHCHMGYHLQGEPLLTCVNASRPVWNKKEPTCRALCGGTVKNATLGRVLSPSPYHWSNVTRVHSCSWSLEAAKEQRLHLHLERLLLGPSDRCFPARLVLWSGLDVGSVVLFDSGRSGHVPFEGVISEGPVVKIQFFMDQPDQNTGFNIRYEAFERGRCYEPYLQNGNFSTSDPLYGVGAVVQFTCDPGHALEQGPPVIECISARDPYWNDTEPLCKAQCGGDLSGPGGIILSPNWPEWYGEGEECAWSVHVEEDKRVLIDVQLLNISDGDLLTVTDGDDGAARLLGRYAGGRTPFKLFSSTPDLSVTFHSDPAGLVQGKGEGFIINYMEVSRNDSCTDLPEIQNGWKTRSDGVAVRGARVTYQCDPGYDLQGGATVTCQLDLSWSAQPPFCQKIMYCTDPGHVEHATRSLSDSKLLVGTTIRYRCSPRYILQGGATLTCYGREPGTPVWTSHLPRCIPKDSLLCANPGVPDNGYQVTSKRVFEPGETLAFVCYHGYQLVGDVAIKCVQGSPSYWSGPLPICRADHACFANHALEVSRAGGGVGAVVDGGSLALVAFILVLLISVLLGGIYLLAMRGRPGSNLGLPLVYQHPYRQITVEAEIDNPLYEAGSGPSPPVCFVCRTLVNMKSPFEELCPRPTPWEEVM
ncbi:seizure 6-like protein isoform X2 [Phyllopteryx taeniolatus]|uniref:seizure 6-like protein isoform X2 n=1 Tax=Phyllopteryx taeniolatus TaxID=161469 RepID=UPI002AD4CAFE|nr:seizure 6-like protein isoform X2 [Phyllopteryx taeniolatus]